jgi:hypothetical protein
MLLLNGVSLFGCFLVASGAGFGLWYIKNTIFFKVYGNLFTFKSYTDDTTLFLGCITSQPCAIILFTFLSYM